MKRQRIKRETRKYKNYYNPVPESTKEERRRKFLLIHCYLQCSTNTSRKLKCQVKGCHNGAITLKGKIKVCHIHCKQGEGGR